MPLTGWSGGPPHWPETPPPRWSQGRFDSGPGHFHPERRAAPVLEHRGRWFGPFAI